MGAKGHSDLHSYEMGKAIDTEKNIGRFMKPVKSYDLAGILIHPVGGQMVPGSDGRTF